MRIEYRIEEKNWNYYIKSKFYRINYLIATKKKREREREKEKDDYLFKIKKNILIKK